MENFVNKSTSNGILWPANGTNFPEPASAITQEEFIKLITTSAYPLYGYYHTQSKLPFKLNEERLITWNVKYFWHNLYGVAAARCYFPDRDIAAEGYWVQKSERYDGYAMRYFKIGCEHTFKEWTTEDYEANGKRRFRGDHIYACTKCGTRYGFSSAD